MARITIADCVEKVKDRFELVILAANRAKSLAAGSVATIPSKGEKPAVTALREIAAGKIDIERLRTNTAYNFGRQKFAAPIDVAGEDEISESLREDAPEVADTTGLFSSDNIVVED
jgi:DNA-directed RNA polymerase subunit omega